MAHLYVSPVTDSVYLDVTAGDRSAVTMTEPAEGVFLHVNEATELVAIEVMGLSQRGGLQANEPDLGHLHVNTNTDSIYLDVSAGTRSPVKMGVVADGVHLHVDDAGSLVGIEVMNLTARGGLHVDDLDAVPGSPRPALFDEIERAAARPSGAETSS